MADLNINRVRFGALVAALRDDLKWKQKDLEIESGIPLRIIQEVEEGRRVDLLRDDVLLRLASGLKLTTLERQQFLFAASGVESEDFLREKMPLVESKFKEYISDLKNIVLKMRSPVFVVDSYCDVLLANKLVIEFLKIPPKILGGTTDKIIIDGRNMLRVLFHPDSNYRDLVGKDWKRQALLNLRFFRRTSLRYRGNPYFAALKTELEKYEEFRTYWKSTIAEVDDETNSYATYTLNFPGMSTIEYFGTEVFLGISSYSELFMNLYLPQNNFTAGKFEEMYKAIGPSCEEFWQFGDKRKWDSWNNK